MRITFFSNFLNHHQTPFCDEMYKELGDNFSFVATEETPESFLKSGYPDCRKYSYNLLAYENASNYEKAIRLGLDSDIVIIGSAPNIFIKQRIRQNKHTFRYSERMLKEGEWRLFDPRVLFSLLKQHTMLRNKNVYMLCASAYTANDLNLIFAYPYKKYKWGYFTQVDELKIEQIIDKKPTECIQLLWVARFIDWKHPEMAIKLAVELKKKAYDFHLKMIGVGEIFEPMKEMIVRLNLSDCITLLGSMDNAGVRNHMQNSNIFLFTSDRNEGWGAVLNEAMSCGCAVVASNAIGAVPFLIEHKQNGLVFKSRNLSSLVEHTEKILKDKTLRDEISKNAYFTMYNEWSPKIATYRFLKLSKSIIQDKKLSFDKGPCSAAHWTKKQVWIK